MMWYSKFGCVAVWKNLRFAFFFENFPAFAANEPHALSKASSRFSFWMKSSVCVYLKNFLCILWTALFTNWGLFFHSDAESCWKKICIYIKKRFGFMGAFETDSILTDASLFFDCLKRNIKLFILDYFYSQYFNLYKS